MTWIQLHLQLIKRLTNSYSSLSPRFLSAKSMLELTLPGSGQKETMFPSLGIFFHFLCSSRKTTSLGQMKQLQIFKDLPENLSPKCCVSLPLFSGLGWLVCESKGHGFCTEKVLMGSESKYSWTTTSKPWFSQAPRTCLSCFYFSF